MIHQIESEVLSDVSSAGKHSARMLGMLRASPAMGYPKDGRPVSFEGHNVIWRYLRRVESRQLRTGNRCTHAQQFYSLAA
ncbi:DUF2471 family protein [Caballeronia calidae]|uniref:DUF2471 family protein n=1 Tax=Caballeronia calidae TaxID=1777139 RepID=UPI0035B5119B